MKKPTSGLIPSTATVVARTACVHLDIHALSITKTAVLGISPFERRSRRICSVDLRLSAVTKLYQKTAGAFPIYETGGRRFLDACIHNTREPKTKLREYLNYTTRRDSVSRDSFLYLHDTY